MTTLSPPQIRRALKVLKLWSRKGSVIRRVYKFKDFVAAMKFVNLAARKAEKAWHHPDIDIRWNQVTLALTTHDAGGLTELDFTLAHDFDKLSRRKR